MQPFNDADAERNSVLMILREVSDGNLMAPGGRAGIDGKRPIVAVDETRGVTDQRLQKRRLPCSVTADQSDLFTPANRGVEIVQEPERNDGTLVRLREAPHFKRLSFRSACGTG